MSRNPDRALHGADFPGGATTSGQTGVGGSGLRGRLDQLVGSALLRALHEPDFALELADGTRVALPGAQPTHTVRFRDRGALWRLLRNPRLHFGDLYSAGRLEVEGALGEFMRGLYVSIDEAMARTPAFWQYLWRDHRPRATDRRSARENIHQHYDIGNAFYRLWLDEPWMQYTCAYYPRPGMTLAEAQEAKLEHVCRKLRLEPGMEVVEAGCGWGGLALYMAERHGVRVRAWNISEEQVRFARERARERGLADRVEYVLDDYRNIDGPCDRFVSVGMLEHVGLRHFGELGDVVNRSLAADGLALIHSIGRNRPGNMNAWIERRIFPGAYPPSLFECEQIFQPHSFSILDVENLRLHYANTLRDWIAGFEANADRVREMFDADFERAWRLYLNGSMASFLAGKLQLFQVVFARERNNAVPMNREHLYTTERT